MKTFYLSKKLVIISLFFFLGVVLTFLGFQKDIKNIAWPVFNRDPQVNVVPHDQKHNSKKETTKTKAQSSNTGSLEKKKDVEKEFFIEYRLERDRNRDRQLEIIREIVNNKNSGEEARREAQQRLLGISKNMEKEMELENLLKARNYKDAIAMIQEQGLTVIVKLPRLSAEDIAKVTEVAEQTTGIDRSKIIVIAKM